MFKFAITRLPGENFSSGLTTSDLGEPSYNLILDQHQAYIDALRSLGLEVLVLPPLITHPDAYFVEDPAIVTSRVAIISRPGASSRQGEEVSLASVLAQYRPLERIFAPGSVDGGDVLMVGDHFFIGLSERTNQSGAEQLSAILRNYGHTSDTVLVGKGLHLKSSVNWLGNDRLIITQALHDHPAFNRFKRILLDVREEYAANTLWINGTLLYPKGYPGAKEQLESLDMPLIELDVSEVHKMDGGLTCMSLRFS